MMLVFSPKNIYMQLDRNLVFRVAHFFPCWILSWTLRWQVAESFHCISFPEFNIVLANACWRSHSLCRPILRCLFRHFMNFLSILFSCLDKPWKVTLKSRLQFLGNQTWHNTWSLLWIWELNANNRITAIVSYLLLSKITFNLCIFVPINSF